MKKNKSRIVRQIFLSLLVIILLQTTSFAKDFKDVKSDHWAYYQIKQLALDGIISGNTDGSFRPNEQITRSQFAKILAGTFKLEIKPRRYETYRDVKMTDWVHPYVEALADYMLGYKSSDGAYNFKGDMPALREEMAAAIVKIKGFDKKEPKEETLNQFIDKDQISDNLKKYVAIAVEKKIMKGDGRKFNPKGALTRSEATMMIYNASYATTEDSKAEDAKQNTTILATNKTSSSEDMKDIPTNKFKASYMKTDNSSKVVASEIVDKISLNFSYDFNGIIAQNFSAKWSGYLEFPKSTKKVVNISNSWSDVTLKINDEVVKSQTYTFKKGLNKVEVSYVNHGNIVNFTVNFQDENIIYTYEQAKKALSSLVKDNTVIEYVGVYKSNDQKNEIKTYINKSGGDVILFLGSYSPVNWTIENSKDANIKAIVYNSYEPGTTVSYANTSIPIFRYNDLGYGYEVGDIMGKINSAIEKLLGRGIDDYEGTYSTNELKVAVPNL